MTAWRAILIAIVVGAPTVAHAYRPFDGTDADVAKQGEFELELGPVELYRETGTTFLIAPATVLNLGIAPRLELVVDFSNFVALRAVPATRRRTALRDTDVLLKGVLRRGALQGESGPSVAVEAGMLMPEIGDDDGVGAQANTIISFSGGAGTLHFNELVADNRDHRFEWFSGVILEAPSGMVIRPVAELLVDHVSRGGTEYSALAGVICHHDDDLDFDIAARGARIDGAPAWELRLGLTWVTKLWQPGPH